MIFKNWTIHIPFHKRCKGFIIFSEKGNIKSNKQFYQNMINMNEDIDERVI